MLILPVDTLSVRELLVEALVVEACRIWKLEVLPQSVEMIAEVIEAKIDERPVVVVVAETERLVEVELVIVPLVEIKLVILPVIAFEVVALVVVE